MSEPGVSESTPAPAAKPAYAQRRSRLVRRVLPLLVLGGLAVWYFRDAPKETTLVYALGPRSAGLAALQVDLLELPSRARVRHVEYRYSPAAPAPSEQEHRLKLKPGRYEIDATLVPSLEGAPAARVTRAFSFDGEERITVSLAP